MMKKMLMMLAFVLMGQATVMAQKTVISQRETKEKTFDVVEQMPQFPGGPAAMMQYLYDNVKYPVEAQKKKVEGRVIANFIVEKDGTVVEPSILKSVSPELDAEALRVIIAMPKWTPGKQSGKAVRVKYTIPIAFKLK